MKDARMKGENLKIACRGTHGHTSSNSFPYTKSIICIHMYI